MSDNQSDELNILKYDVLAPLYEQTDLIDKQEGADVNKLLQTNTEPLSEPIIEVPDDLDRNMMVTSVDTLINWGRKSSVWPLSFGLACCAFEMMASAMSRFDLSRFGMEVFRASPRQADLIIIAGTVTWKMAPVIERVYNQMPEPKWVISMGACASTGGVFNNYALVQGVDEVVPVDIYVPGCPPRPETLIDGILKLQKKIEAEGLVKN